MAPGVGDKKAEKSYLSSAVDSINPWAGKPSQSSDAEAKPDGSSRVASSGAPIDPGDHSITHLYGQSLRTYPPDCPPLNVQWFHAVDVPKRKPQLGREPRTPDANMKQAGPAKKFSAFSISDSSAIEGRYQKLLEATENHPGQVPTRDPLSSTDKKVLAGRRGVDGKEDVSEAAVHVPVNEDFLFDVNIEKRELAPVYWLGPVYEVRRGTWFFQEGSHLRPCEENLAAQLEEGYLKVKPWLNPVRSRSQSGTKWATPKASQENLKTAAEVAASLPSESSQKTPGSGPSAQPLSQPQSYRLFGTYMNSIATYQDSTTAWLSSDTVLSWVTSSMYERFAGGGYMSGVRLTRGYSEQIKSKDRDEKERDKDKEKEPVSSVSGDIPGLDERQQRLLKRRSAPATTKSPDEMQSNGSQTPSGGIEGREARLQRQLSSLIEGDSRRNPEDTEEQIQYRQEQEIQDYHTQAGEVQGRDVDHLILVTHGIGQQLSLRMESVNFVHDVNVLRKTLKSVYANSADLKALNSELGVDHGNCRVQVLPVCWRHLLDFPKRREKYGEHDLGDLNEDEDAYPSLDDITVEGITFARSLMSDLALDVLLYQSSYRQQISRIVLKECNRIVSLYRERNPEFRGKIHVMGHSLGSAILFDILCRQKDQRLPEEGKGPLRVWPYQGRSEVTGSKEKLQDMEFHFDIEDFYCLGSPIGLFQMLEGRTISARHSADNAHFGNDMGVDLPEDPFLSAPMGNKVEGVSPPNGLLSSVSSPKIRQLYNIFHPSDPISYRLEPLVSPAMTKLKPQGLPYTKRGLLNAANQGLTGIGAKVGQSVSGLWSSLSAGIANNMLNRSLGLTNDEVAQMADQGQAGLRQQPPGEASKSSKGNMLADDPKISEKTDERKKQLANSTASGGLTSASGHDPTLIDDELETLFSQFQKRRTVPTHFDGGEGNGKDEKHTARKLRTEENKVRALNRNGRIDYSIQESVLDFNPMNTIASHMGYWADVDVNHFILSQLLSRRLKTKGRDAASK